MKSKQFKRLVKQIKAYHFFAQRVDEAPLPFFPGLPFFLLQQLSKANQKLHIEIFYASDNQICDLI